MVLDTRITISAAQEHPVVPLLEKEISTIPLDFHRKADENHIDLFVCGNARAKLSGILSSLRPKERGDCLVARVRTEEMVSASTIMDDIDRMPSAVRGGMYLKENKIFMDYRLHSSCLDEFTKTGKRIAEMNNGIMISDLGPSYGGASNMDFIDERIHLGVVSFEADILGEIGLPPDKELYMEYNFARRDEKGFRAVVYGEGQNGLTFSTQYISSKLLDEMNRLSVGRRIPKAAILARTSGGMYRSATFIPFSMMRDHVSVLYEAAGKHPDTKFKLVAARSYDRSVWEWV